VTRRAACYAAPLAALLAASLIAQAQENSRARRGGPPVPDEPDRGAIERHALGGEFSAHVAEVQQRLKLQKAQQAAWDAYARRVQALMLDQLRGVPRGPDNEDGLHQINRRVDIVRNRLAAMEDIADAAAQLYALLSPEQRKVADDLLPTTVPALYSGLPEFPRGPVGQPITRKKGP
jgi:hypothetical protein